MDINRSRQFQVGDGNVQYNFEINVISAYPFFAISLDPSRSRPGSNTDRAAPSRRGGPGASAQAVAAGQPPGGQNENPKIDDILGQLYFESHGRSPLIPKYVYLKLMEDGRAGDADSLLKSHLDVAFKKFHDSSDASGIAEICGIVVAAMDYFSSEEVVQAWVNTSRKNSTKVIGFVAYLLASDPAGTKKLAWYMGSSSSWKLDDIVILCRGLKCKNPDADKPDAYEIICEALAARTDIEELATIIQGWDKRPTDGKPDGLPDALPSLSEDLNAKNGLLAKIVAPEVPNGTGAREPRDTAFLDELAENSGLRHNSKLVSSLRIAAAKQVYAREPWEIAYLLRKVKGRRKLWRTARAVNSSQVNRLRGRKIRAEEIDAGEFVEYVLQLRNDKSRSSDLIFWAIRAFSDPARSDWERIAPMAGEVAAGLFARAQEPEMPSGRGEPTRLLARLLAELRKPQKLDQAAFELLERFLGNEQKMTAEAAVGIVLGVRGRHPEMRDDPRWEELWESAVGGWADADHRKKVIDEFDEDHFDKDQKGGKDPRGEKIDFSKEREAIKRSVQ